VIQAEASRILLCQNEKVSDPKKGMNSAMAQIWGRNPVTDFSLQQWEKDIGEIVVSPAREKIAHQVREKTSVKAEKGKTVWSEKCTGNTRLGWRPLGSQLARQPAWSLCRHLHAQQMGRRHSSSASRPCWESSRWENLKHLLKWSEATRRNTEIDLLVETSFLPHPGRS
jgi:hypothetical protein